MGTDGVSSNPKAGVDQCLAQAVRQRENSTFLGLFVPFRTSKVGQQDSAHPQDEGNRLYLATT